MTISSSVEQGYLQAPEYGESGFNTEAVQKFVAGLRAKIEAVAKAELKSLVPADISEKDLAACVDVMDGYLSDMLGDLPLWRIGQRNDSLDALSAAYDGAASCED